MRNVVFVMRPDKASYLMLRAHRSQSPIKITDPHDPDRVIGEIPHDVVARGDVTHTISFDGTEARRIDDAQTGLWWHIRERFPKFAEKDAFNLSELSDAGYVAWLLASELGPLRDQITALQQRVNELEATSPTRGLSKAAMNAVMSCGKAGD